MPWHLPALQAQHGIRTTNIESENLPLLQAFSDSCGRVPITIGRSGSAPQWVAIFGHHSRADPESFLEKTLLW